MQEEDSQVSIHCNLNQLSQTSTKPQGWNTKLNQFLLCKLPLRIGIWDKIVLQLHRHHWALPQCPFSLPVSQTGWLVCCGTTQQSDQGISQAPLSLPNLSFLSFPCTCHWTDALTPNQVKAMCPSLGPFYEPSRSVLGCKERQLNPDQSSFKGVGGEKRDEGKGYKDLWCNLIYFFFYLRHKIICVRKSYTQYSMWWLAVCDDQLILQAFMMMLSWHWHKTWQWSV